MSGATDRGLRSVEVLPVAPRWLFVKVTTADDLVGWGEAIVPKRARAVTGAVADLAAVLDGCDTDRIEDAVQRMRMGGFFRDGPILATAAAAIEQALWDVKGHRYGLPVHEFLGGAVRDHLRTYAWVGGDRTEPVDLVAQVGVRIEQGYATVKLNATAALDVLDSRAAVRAVCEPLGAVRDTYGLDVDIALDFHGRVHVPMAKVLLAELEQYRPLWVEEPVPPGHEDALVDLARSTSIPLATGERVLTRTGFARLLEQRAVSVLQPDVSLTGLFELEKICRMADAYDVAVAPHCPNGPISLAATLQVACCAGNVPIQECSVGLHYHAGYAGLPMGELQDYLTDPAVLSTDGGRLARPTGPGLGIGIDEVKVRASPAWSLADPQWRLPDGRLAEW